MARAKLKTHRGAAKRFRKTAGGKFAHRQTGRNHNLGRKKPGPRRRRLRITAVVAKAEAQRLARILPYA